MCKLQCHEQVIQYFKWIYKVNFNELGWMHCVRL